jgi:Cu+-exporting ATPase
MKATKWEVKGMNCVSCSGAVTNLLKSMNMDNIHVDFSTDEVVFENTPGLEDEKVIKGIEQLGYKVILPDDPKKKGSTLSFG